MVGCLSVVEVIRFLVTYDCDHWLKIPVFFNRQHLSDGGCLEVRGKIIRTVLCCIVYLSCAVISTLRWAVLTVLWIEFCHPGPISLCIDYLFFYVYFVCFCFILHSCCIIMSVVGWTWWDWRLILGTYLLRCFDTVDWVIWPIKTRPRYDL